jgi:hypothetical protein
MSVCGFYVGKAAPGPLRRISYLALVNADIELAACGVRKRGNSACNFCWLDLDRLYVGEVAFLQTNEDLGSVGVISAV